MFTKLYPIELEKILVDLSASPDDRLAAVQCLARLETVKPRLLLAMEQAALRDPSPEVQQAALEALSQPHYLQAYCDFSSLDNKVRSLLKGEIDRWAQDQLVSPKVARLLRGRVGFGESPKPASPLQESKAAQPAHQAATLPMQEVRAAQPAPQAATPVVPAQTIAAPAQQPVTQVSAVAAVVPADRPVEAKPAPPPQPPAKKAVPFDQWLLSERNIKIALYSGGALLVVAGIIFISVNWMRIPGLLKFLITLLVTGLMYLGGYLLIRKPLLHIGGVALTAVASGFLPLNFAVLQIYVLGPRGLPDDVMWLIASPLCMLVYMLIAYWTKSNLFTFYSLAAYLSTVAAALVVANSPQLVYGLVSALAFLALLILARFFRSTRLADFTCLPLLIVAHAGTALTILANIGLWMGELDCAQYYGCNEGSPWLALLGLAIGGVFYLVADRLFKSRIPRWLAAFLFCGTFFLALVQLNASREAFHYAMLLIPLAYFGIGYVVERREKKQSGALPLYSVASLVALIGTLVTGFAYLIDIAANAFDTGILIFTSPEFTANLARALFVDILLLLGAEFLLGVKLARWAYAFLFPAAFFFTLLSWQVLPLAQVVLLMVLAMAYLGGGYMLKLTEKRPAGDLPFYIAAYTIAGFATLLATQQELFIMIALYLDVILLVATDVLLKRLEARWAAVFLFCIPFFQSLNRLNLNGIWISIILMLLSLAYLAGGTALKLRDKRQRADWPFYFAAYAIAIAATAMVIDRELWLMIILYLDVVLLVATNILLKRIEARWIAAFLFPVPFYLSLDLLELSQTWVGVMMMLLSLAYLGLGYALQYWEKRKASAWPLYAAAYTLALLVTYLAVDDREALIKILFADVALLILSALIHHSYWWVYGATWLFMLPIYLTINEYTEILPNQGLLMGILGLAYTAAGYVLGRRALRLGAPFLSCAAFLSVLVVVFAWSSSPTASVMLAIIAILYLLAALWLSWPWLLPVSWLAVNLLCLALGLIIFEGSNLYHALAITSAVLGAGLLAGSYFVQRKAGLRWSLPVLLCGIVSLGGAYLAGLILGGWLAVGISILTACYLLVFTWLVKNWIGFPILTYLGLVPVTTGYFFTINEVGGLPALTVWPVYAAILCACFVLIAWLLRHKPTGELYSQPLHWAGILAMFVPMAGTLWLFEWPEYIALVFGIASITYLADTALRKILYQAYLGLATLVLTIWAVLVTVEVSEPQAYCLPLAIMLLVVGWSEHVHHRRLSYLLTSLLGLLVSLGSAYYQSLYYGEFVYAILLLVESLLALAWGIWQRKRIFVEVGGIALVVNAVTQLGPGFVHMERWIQIALIGSILFGLGLSALFKRQDILTTRQKLSETWKQWEL